MHYFSIMKMFLTHLSEQYELTQTSYGATQYGIKHAIGAFSMIHHTHIEAAVILVTSILRFQVYIIIQCHIVFVQ